MATNTSRAGLRKPDGSDNVNYLTDLNDNWDKVDTHLGYYVCTSGTRPVGTNRFTGRTIYETDTKNRYIWTGTEWFLLNKLFAIKSANEVINNSSTFQNDNELALALTPGVWDVLLQAPVGSPTGADFKSQYTYGGTVVGHRRYNLGPAGSGNDNQNTIVTLSANVAYNSSEQYATAGGAVTIIERMVFEVSTASTLQWQWAQNTTTASDTTVFTRAIMTAERLA